jgi:4-amino-4-deoxy-L-arabinose transferase-like glycosyltransferase
VYKLSANPENRDLRTGRSKLVVAGLVLLITLLGLGLRLYRLDAQSLWYDEGFSVYLARMGLGEITANTAADIQPPLYYYLLHGWIQLFGDTELALRSLSVLFGVLTIPLMYAMALRLFSSRLAGLLAALLIAVSPLHVWYGQEARMYTLLTFLCLLSSFLLLLAIDAKKTRNVLILWAAYTLVNVAALYTHYFAIFVLAFQAVLIFVIWVAREFRPLHLILGGLASGVVTLLLYLPWLPYLITRYGADVSYLPGQLKIWEVLVDIVLSFVGGESIPEGIGLLLSFGYGLVLVLCFVALLSAASRAARQTAQESSHALPASYVPLLFLLLYLLLPPALILAFSYNSPKFNARYVMISQPAFLLLVAGGLAVLWTRRTSVLRDVLRLVLAASCLIFLLGVSVYANSLAYTDPAFARADFRGVARYLREHVGPDETIILTSGHMFPAFDYYAPDIERHLLPDSPTLDVTQTLDYSIATDLNEWLAGKDGVWLVLWQDEVVDPTGYLTTMLDEVGDEQPVERTFPQIKVRHYRLPENAFLSEEPSIAHPADFNFGDRLRLLGYTQPSNRQVMLFWEALQQLGQDYRVSLVLRDTAGQSWGQWDGRPSAYLYPTDRWRVGQIIFGRYDLMPIPGTPPGDYGLEVGVYTEEDPVGLDVLDLTGAPQGKRAMLGAVKLDVPAVTADQLDVPHPDRIEVGDGLVLLGWDLDPGEAQPGDRLLLTLFWSAESQPAGTDKVRVLVTDVSGQVWDAGTFPPTNAWHPTSIWLPGQAWRGQTTFRLPIQAEPGEAHLAIQLVDAGGAPLGPAAELTAIEVLPTTRIFSPPQPQAQRQANFDDKILLLGADVAPDPVAPGGTLSVTLYWQALAEMDVPYSVFVHLLGPDGQVVTGHDGEPASGTRPTTGWVPGEFITDLHEVPVPADLSPGQYVIEVGLYDAGAPGMPRLPVLGKENQIETDRVIFGPAKVR